jgi:hypothetical protein
MLVSGEYCLMGQECQVAVDEKPGKTGLTSSHYLLRPRPYLGSTLQLYNRSRWPVCSRSARRLARLSNLLLRLLFPKCLSTAAVAQCSSKLGLAPPWLESHSYQSSRVTSKKSRNSKQGRLYVLHRVSISWLVLGKPFLPEPTFLTDVATM